MEELNPQNAFGELLLDLIEAQYGGDIDAGIQALVEATGLAEEEVVAVIQGEIIVEDAALLADIADAFPDADDEDLAVLVNVAEEVEVGDREELISEIEANEVAMSEEVPMEEEMIPEEEMAAYGYQAKRQANFRSNQTQALQQRVNQLEATISNFGAYNSLSAELRALDAEAGRYVDAGMLPPSYKAMLVGNFSEDNERVAKFSAISERNGVDAATMLFATKYALGMLKDAANFIEFKDYSASEDEVATANFSASLDETVKRDIEAIFGRN